MLEHYLRPRFQRLIIDNFLRIPVISKFMPPNVCTFLAALFGVSVAVPLYFHQVGWAVILLIISGFLDVLDGSIARYQNKTTEIGTVLDIVGDRCVELAVIFGLLLQSIPDRAIICFLMLGSVLLCVTSFLVVGIFSENNTEKSFYYSSGLMERLEAFIFFGLMMVMPKYFVALGLLFIGLVFLTTVIRLVEFAIQKKVTAR